MQDELYKLAEKIFDDGTIKNVKFSASRNRSALELAKEVLYANQEIAKGNSTPVTNID